jgi:hypothetical protein
MHHTRGFFHFQYLKTLLTGMLLVTMLLRGLGCLANSAGVAALHSTPLN